MANNSPASKEIVNDPLFGHWDFIRHSSFVIWFFVSGLLIAVRASGANTFSVLKPDSFRHHIERFNSMEPENITNFVSNAGSFAWLTRNIPLFECPDRDMEEVYYF